MVESTKPQQVNAPEMILGLCWDATNRLLTQPCFTPSKVGGIPANISPLPKNAHFCPKCNKKLTFICQLYANVPQLPNHHRLIYVFACLSEQCIGKPGCFHAFRETVPDKHPYDLRICNDDDYDEICNKTDDDLIATQQWVQIVEALPERHGFTLTKDECILEEYLLDTIYEDRQTTKKYIQHSNRIAAQYKNKNYNDEGDEQEELDLEYISLQFGKGNKDFKDKAEQLLKAYKDNENEDLGQDDEDFSDDDQKD